MAIALDPVTIMGGVEDGPGRDPRSDARRSHVLLGVLVAALGLGPG